MEKSFSPKHKTFTVEQLIECLNKIENKKAKVKIYLNQIKDTEQFVETGRYNISFIDNTNLFDGKVIDLVINSNDYV